MLNAFQFQQQVYILKNIVKKNLTIFLHCPDLYKSPFYPSKPPTPKIKTGPCYISLPERGLELNGNRHQCCRKNDRDQIGVGVVRLPIRLMFITCQRIFLKSMKTFVRFCRCWRNLSHNIVRFQIYPFVLCPALNPACSSTVIFAAVSVIRHYL